MSAIEHDLSVPFLRFDRYWTVEEWHRAGDEGYFAPDERVELFRGRAVLMSPMKGRHFSLAAEVARALSLILSQPDVLVVSSLPISLNPENEPLPDVMVLIRHPHRYLDRIPSSPDAHLIIEISDTTRSYDLHEKAAEYARAGIHEYWVCDVKMRRVVVHRGPNPDGIWETVESFSGDASVSPLRFPQVALTVEQLTGPPSA